MKEQWRPIVIGDLDYSGLYEVSNLGRVRFLPKPIKHWSGISVTRKGGTMKPVENNMGYPRVLLRGRGKPRNLLVSRLVATAFIGEIPEGYVVHHIDSNPKNNRIENLEIISFRENLSSERTIKSKLPTGVKAGSTSNTWQAGIYFHPERKYINLGSYRSIGKASLAYQIALELIECPDIIVDSIIIKQAMIDYKIAIKSKPFNSKRQKSVKI